MVKHSAGFLNLPHKSLPLTLELCWGGCPTSGLNLQINKSSRKPSWLLQSHLKHGVGGKINAREMEMNGIDAE